MKAWDDLVAAALLGTARAPALDPALPGPAGDLLGKLEPATAERRLLGAAAIVTVWSQVGAQPAPARADLPAPAAHVDERPRPPAAAVHLGEILQGEMGSLLDEWLVALAAAGRCLPPRWLPEVLDLAQTNPALQPLVNPVLGTHGYWLAPQNPEWQRVSMPEEATEAWETGSRADRLAIVRRLRARDPERARALLAAGWPQEAPADRAELLAALATGLSPADEPFLEDALADRRREVRAAAAGLLVTLPGSRLVQRLAALVQPLVRLERGLLGRETLRVALPQAWNEEMARAGLVEPAPSGMGKGAWWLMQLLAAVPPAGWCREWRKKPEDILHLAAKDEHRTAVLEGLATAAARQRDPDWAQAFVVRWLAEPWEPAAGGRGYGLQANLEDLLAALPAEWADPWLAARFRAVRGMPSDSQRLYRLLVCYRRPWGEALTDAFLQAARGWAGRPYDPAMPWTSTLPDLARYACPALAGEAARGWPDDPAGKERIERFVAILRFRRDMLVALQ